MKHRIIRWILSVTAVVCGPVSAALTVDQAEVLYYNTGAAETGCGTASAASFDSPAAALNNPAGLAVTEQLKFSIFSGDILGNYGYVLGTAAIPTSRGILGVSARYWKSPLRSSVQEAFGGGLSWSKTFTDRLNFGLGFKFNEIYYNLGLSKYPQFGIDAGGLYLRRFDMNPLKDVRLQSWSVGASVLNIANPMYDIRGRHVGYPFQIRIGTAIGAEFFNWYKLGANADFLLANFIDPRFQIGLENTFDDRVVVSAGYQFGNELNHVAFGLGYKFGFKTMDGRFTVAFLPLKNRTFSLSAGVDLTFGAVDTQAPKIELELTDGASESVPHFYISPNYDGVRDSVKLNLTIKDNRELEFWKIEVKDAQGTAVRTWTSPDIRTLKGKLTFVKVMTRMFEKEKEVPVPPSIVWDGRNDHGVAVPDGIYSIALTARDKNKNETSAILRTVVVDTVAPRADIKSDLTLFSPDNDGAKDLLSVTQKCEGEDSWSAEFRNDQNVAIRKWSWEGQLPDSKIVWDGRDESGVLAPNGVYLYVLSGHDKAGNSVERRIPNITLSTDKQAASVDASLDLFSPNSDGVLDTVVFRPFLSSESGLDHWEVLILNEDGQPVRSFKGTAKLNKAVEWDGTDENGRIVPDGNYFYRFKSVFANGNHPESFTKALVSDITPPQADLSLTPEEFSPDGDGKDDRLTISQTVSDPSGIRDWSLTLRSEQGQAVKTLNRQGTPSGQIIWDGIKDDGTRVKGGEIYTAVLEAIDNANNRTVTPAKSFKIQTVAPEITMDVKQRIFSPDGDGEADEQTISFSRFDSKTLAGWTLTFLLVDREKKTETPVRSWSGTDLPTEIVWDGVKDDGTLVRGGEIYKVAFTAADVLSNSTTLKAQFAVDSTPPLVEMKLDPMLFSPDGDGANDQLAISFVRKDKKKLADWSLEIRPQFDKGPGSLFKTFKAEQLPADPLIWNGYSDADELVESAQDYQFKFVCRDVLGNVSEQVNVLPVDILVIQTPFGLMIKISTIRFEYNSADLKDERSLKILDKVARILQRYRTYKVQVDGHTDNIGSQAYNLDLSTRRAQTVMNYLVKKGVSMDNLRARGIGLLRPTADNATEEGRAKNRRVEFLLYKSGEWPVEATTTTNAAPAPVAP
jgi:outer membrane protein OmpA-like peptidoglycan-associated protein/flagellar hook assembly protein FlgD